MEGKIIRAWMLKSNFSENLLSEVFWIRKQADDAPKGNNRWHVVRVEIREMSRKPGGKHASARKGK